MVLAVTTTLEVAGLPPVRLREERDNEDVPLRTGCRVWSCARLLSAWLASACASGGSGGGADGADDADAGRGRSFAPRVAGRDVLELGAGTGAVGLVCALLGARSVTMTDRDEATLALVHANARLNGHYDPNASCEVSARALDWGDLATYHARAYDLIVAADVLYLPEHCDALPAAAAAHLAPGGQLVVACGLRRAGLMERLVDAIRARGLRPVVHRDALVLRDDDPRDAAAITAAEHAHDGAQIAAAGGYVLVACEAPEDWSPLSDVSSDGVARARRRREEEESESESEDARDERVVDETVTASVAAEMGKVRGFAETGELAENASSRRANATPPTPPSSSERSSSDVGSDANSAMGEFLDALADLDVEEDRSGANVGSAHRRTAYDDERDDEDDAVSAKLPPTASRRRRMRCRGVFSPPRPPPPPPILSRETVSLSSRRAMDAGSSPRTCSTRRRRRARRTSTRFYVGVAPAGSTPDATYFDSPRCAVARGVDGGSTSPRSGDVDETVDGAVIRRPRSISQRGVRPRRRRRRRQRRARGIK